MGEIQTISYVGVSDVNHYPDMDNDQYNIRRFKNYCFNNKFLCHFEDGNITPGGLLWGKTANYNVRNLGTTTPITPNTAYTFISYHNNVPSRQLKVYCNSGANLVAEFPAGNNGISLVTGITPGTITNQTYFNLYNFPNGGTASIDFGWIMVLPYVANDWPLPALWCKTGANILNTGMGANKGHILVSNTYTEGLAYNNNITMGEPCFYYLDDTLLPTNLQGNEPMILYNGRRSATLPEATSNEDAILKIQQDQNLLIYDADMSDYVYYDMENTTLLFDFGNLNTYDGSNEPQRIYNLKNTLWNYYLSNNSSVLGSGLRVNHSNGNPSSKSFKLQGRRGFYNNNNNSNLAIPTNGGFVIGIRVKLHPVTNGNYYKTIIELKPSIKLLWVYDSYYNQYRITLTHNNIIMCTLTINTSIPTWATIIAVRLSNGRYYLTIFNSYMSTNTIGSLNSQPLIATNGQLHIGGDEAISNENGDLEFGLIQVWMNYPVDYITFQNIATNFHDTVSPRWPD